MADRPIPARSEVPEESTWNLKDVFESNEAWQAEYEAFKAVPEQIEAFRGRLGESAETLLEWFRLNDALSVRLEKLYGYANCKGDEDTGNGFYQGMRAKALATLVAIDAASAFETPEIMALDEDTVNLFYAAQPELETYRRNIYKIRRRKAHILSPEERKAPLRRRRDGERPGKYRQRLPRRRSHVPGRDRRRRKRARSHERDVRPPAHGQRPRAAQKRL